MIQHEPLQLQDDLTYEEKPIEILDRHDKVLRNKTLPLVKVLWANHTTSQATWELEFEMRVRYHYLFES